MWTSARCRGRGPHCGQRYRADHVAAGGAVVVVDTNQSQSGSERPSVIARPRCFLLHSRVEGTLSTLRAHPNAREGTQSYEVAFALRSPVATVFSTYIDTDRWRHRGFANDVRWVQGKSAMTPAVSVDISREDGRNRTAQSKSNFVGLSAFPGIRMGSKRRQRTLHSGV